MAQKPCDISEEQLEEVLDGLREGKSLNKISKEIDYASYSALHRRLTSTPELTEKYYQARSTGLEKHASELIDIVERPMDNPYNSVEINKRRLEVDTKKWLISKQVPRFKDKVDVNHGGQVDNPLVAKIERVIVDPSE